MGAGVMMVLRKQAPLAALPTELFKHVFSFFDKEEASEFAIRMAKSGDLNIIDWLRVRKFPCG